MVSVPVNGLAGNHVATTIALPAVPDAVKTPELVRFPAVAGLTDQTTENPGGGLGEAVNVVVDPAPTVTGEGSTVRVTGRGLGFGKPFSVAEPLPQSASPAMTTVSAKATKMRRALSFVFERASASPLMAGCAILVLNHYTKRKESADERVEELQRTQQSACK